MTGRPSLRPAAGVGCRLDTALFEPKPNTLSDSADPPPAGRATPEPESLLEERRRRAAPPLRSGGCQAVAFATVEVSAAGLRTARKSPDDEPLELGTADPELDEPELEEPELDEDRRARDPDELDGARRTGRLGRCCRGGPPGPKPRRARPPSKLKASKARSASTWTYGTPGPEKKEACQCILQLYCHGRAEQMAGFGGGPRMSSPLPSGADRPAKDLTRWRPTGGTVCPQIHSVVGEHRPHAAATMRRNADVSGPRHDRACRPSSGQGRHGQ